MTKSRIRSTAVAVGLALAGMHTGAMAGGFAIANQSGSGTGNAFAGGAAAAEDASVAWYNPAGMTALPVGSQVTIAAHLIKPSFKYQDRGSTGIFALPGTGNGGDGGSWAVVPNGHFTTTINPRTRFGFSITVPFGLKTEYDAGWRGQLTGLRSEIKTVNLNPSLAYKLTDTVSVGAGVSVQKLEAELSSFTGVGALGNAELGADDIGYGFNVGVMVQPDTATRVGLTYRSSIKYELEGNAVFTGAAGAAFNGDVRADLKVPDSASLSFFRTLNPKWDVMADITWTGWSSVKRLDIIRTTASAGGAAGSTLSSLVFNWKDTWRFGVGANYKLNAKTKLRFGVALDETPTNDANRTPRLPDQDRTWIAFGVQHKLSKTSVLDFGYAHEFVDDADVNVTVPPAPGTLTGTFENKADIISFQYSHLF